MNVMVTGATGFIGQHLVSELLVRGHRVTAISRDRERFEQMVWARDVKFVSVDLQHSDLCAVSQLATADLLIHLAWPGLPNYKDRFHFEENLPKAYEWIRNFVDHGCPRVLITGTCFEYGAREGCLREDMSGEPTNPYGLGKDSLHRFLRILQTTLPFQLIWARLFYSYGPGQHARSLIAQLDAAIDRGDETFAMSGGEQLRDYLPIEDVAQYLAMLAEHETFDGTVNVCSGRPISVRRLVEQHCRGRESSIKLNLGHYSYPDYEPFAMWGDNSILQSLQSAS